MRAARSCRIAPLLLLLVVGACVVPDRLAGPELSAEEQRAVLTRLSGFTLEGRAAITTASTGTNASLNWQQRGDEALLRLSGPLGMGSTAVEMRGGELRITSSRGEVLEGAVATRALQSQLGFEPPIGALRYWVLGLPTPDGASSESLDGEGRIASLAQQGWQVTYDEYQPQSSAAGTLRMPRRLTATRDALRLRIVIDRWELQP